MSDEREDVIDWIDEVTTYLKKRKPEKWERDFLLDMVKRVRKLVWDNM
jgi:hypothetical protein